MGSQRHDDFCSETCGGGIRQIVWEHQLEGKWQWGGKQRDLHSEAAKGLEKYMLFMVSQRDCDFGQPMLAEIQFNEKSARESLIL